MEIMQLWWKAYLFCEPSLERKDVRVAVGIFSTDCISRGSKNSELSMLLHNSLDGK